MPRWYVPLLAFLAAQPADTTRLTLTVAELEGLAGRSLPVTTATYGYWWQWKRGPLRSRLAAIGWQVAQARGRPLAVTFVRLPSDTSG